MSSDARTSSSDLERFARGLAELRRESGELLGGLSAVRLGWRPSGGGWSIGQVAAHLRTTNEQYAAAMRRGLERAAARGSRETAPHRPTLAGGWLARSMSSARRLPSPPRFRPPVDAADPAAWEPEIDGYLATQDVLEALIRNAEGVDLNATRVTSPVTRLLRMNLGDAFAVWLAHDRRHMLQIRRIREDPGFPPG